MGSHPGRKISQAVEAIVDALKKVGYNPIIHTDIYNYCLAYLKDRQRSLKMARPRIT